MLWQDPQCALVSSLPQRFLCTGGLIRNPGRNLYLWWPVKLPSLYNQKLKAPTWAVEPPRPFASLSRRGDVWCCETCHTGAQQYSEHWNLNIFYTISQVLEFYGDPYYKAKIGNIIHIKLPHAKLLMVGSTFAKFPFDKCQHLMVFRPKKKKKNSENNMGDI